MPTISEQAPDFGDSGYPNLGQQIGPAWRAAWQLLRDGDEHTVTELAAVMVPAGGIQDRTARNLLRQARHEGILSKRVGQRAPGRRYAETIYRVSIEHGGTL
jgi:hypothetical protein